MLRYLLAMMILTGITDARANYLLPDNLTTAPFDCVADAASTYRCPDSIRLGNDETLTLSRDITLIVSGDFRAGKNLVIAGGYRLNIDASGKIELDDNTSFEGDLIAGEKIEIGKNSRISGTLIAQDKIEIKKDTQVVGNVVSGDSLQFDPDVIVYGSCTPSHPQCTGSGATQCGPVAIRDAVVGGVGIEIKGSPLFNGAALSSGKFNGDAVLPIGATQPLTGQPRSLLDTEPTMMPANTSNTIYSMADGETLNASSDVYYEKLTVEGGVSATLAGGGPFHIGKLKVKDDAVLYLEPGDYFIDEIELKDQGQVIVTGDHVNLYIGDKLKMKNSSRLGGGQLTNLRVYGLKGSVEVQFEGDSVFKGMVYSPYGMDITLKNRAIVNASLITRAKVKIEDSARLDLSAAEATAVSQVSTCQSPPPPVLDHFSVSVGAGNASTCSPLALRITAEDGNNDPVTDYTGTVSITTSSGHGNFAVVSASNSLSPNPDNDDNGSVSYGFANADNGSIELSLSNEHAETLSITVSDATIPLSSTSADITFRDNAFEIIDADSAVAGDNVPVAGRDHAYRIRYLRRDPATGVCGLVTGYQGNRNLKLWRQRNSADPGGIAPQLAGVSLPDSEPAAANATVNFTAGEASVSLVTGDIGKYSLEVKDSSRSFADSDIAGSSAEQIVRPFGIGIDFDNQRDADFADNGLIDDSNGSDRSYAADAAGSIFTQAGESFPMTVAGVLWQAVDDADNDGVPDNGSYLGDNPPAPSFGAEGESVIASVSVVAPAGASADTLTIDGSPGGVFNGFVNGGQTANASYGNVGIIDIQARLADNDYFGSGVAISGSAANVGRFNPWQYAVTGSAVTPACNTASAFSYARQPFTASLTLQAWNKAGARTDGYRAGFVTLDIPTELNIVNDRTGLAYDLESYSIVEAFGSGTPGEARFTVQLAWDMPLQGPTLSTAQLIDTRDEVTRVAGSPHDIGGSEIRFGRMMLENSHGTELLDLPLPMRAEYFDGANFLLNTDDGCSSFATDQLVLDSAVESGQTDGDIQVRPGQLSRLSLAHSPLLAGEAGLSLCPPGNPACSPTPGNDGWVDLRLDLSLRPWLRFDWDGDGHFDNDPRARATFGIFKGNDRQIYLRQLFD